MKKSISIVFMLITTSLFVFWLVAFIGIDSFDFLFQNFNYFRYINIAFLAVSIAVPILVFKLNLDKLLSRYKEGKPLPNPDKYILLFTFLLWVFIIIGGLAYTVILNLKNQEITPINLSRLYHIPFLIWGNYFAFVVNYLSFRYFLSKGKE